MLSKLFSLLVATVLLLSACERKSDATVVTLEENKEAKSLLQGIWLDQESEEVAFKAKGDTIYYPDSLSMPAYFRIIQDTLILGNNSYSIVKQAAHVFWFRNQAGDLVKLVKSDNPSDALDFRHKSPGVLKMVSQLQKTDSVVSYGGERYHWYIVINPTRYRVSKTTYNDDGVAVENVYYDNIIHVSVYKGAQKLFSRDIKKQMYAEEIPAEFLDQCILGNMQYMGIDERGFHFSATLCIPDGASCYMVSTDISFSGSLSKKLIEY